MTARVLRARLMLLGAAAVWGSYAVVLRAIYRSPGPLLAPVFITAVRYVIMSIVSVPVWYATTSGHCTDRAFMRASAELGLVGSVANLLSCWGISLMPAVTSETLLGTIHVWVPCLALALGRSRQVGPRTWAGCVVSFAATLVAAHGTAATASNAAGSTLTLPTLALLAAAALYGLARVRLQWHVQFHSSPALCIAAIVWTAVFAVACCALDALGGGASAGSVAAFRDIGRRQWALIVISVLASGLLGKLLAFGAQAVIPAASAQPTFALQPLFTAVWCGLFSREPPSRTIAGAALLMVAGALLASTERVVEVRRLTKGDSGCGSDDDDDECRRLIDVEKAPSDDILLTVAEIGETPRTADVVALQPTDFGRTGAHLGRGW